MVLLLKIKHILTALFQTLPLVCKHYVLKSVLIFSTTRCKENHQTPKLSPEEVDAIAEIEDSIKDRAHAFSEMEAFLPKKNGFDSFIWFIVCIWMTKGSFYNKLLVFFFHSVANMENVKLFKVILKAFHILFEIIKMFKMLLHYK